MEYILAFFGGYFVTTGLIVLVILAGALVDWIINKVER